jgi:hypothetical protein
MIPRSQRMWVLFAVLLALGTSQALAVESTNQWC